MLWVALCFPRLALEARLRGLASPEAAGEAWAVTEGRLVLACNAAAEAAGVRPGSALAAAWALAPQLRVLPRSAAAEKAALETIATWAGQFTSRVSLEPPQDLLLEVEGSLRLFGGCGPLMERMRSGLAQLGFEALLAAGPTARAALWLARGAGESLSLEDLPVHAIDAAPEARALLSKIGIRTLGALLRLPRAGVAVRFGQRLLDDLDRVLGRTPEARDFFVPPARFGAQLELPTPVMEVERVLFAAHRLLLQLEGFLAARQAGVRGFRLSLLRRGTAPSAIDIGFSAPRRDAGHGLRLLRERLGGIALTGAVEAIRLQAARLVPLPGTTRDLLGDARTAAEDWERLAERLQARLGGERVHGLSLHADHRPERAWRAAGNGEAVPAPAGPRPLWLLELPRRIEEGDFVLLAGPERIESGWWDGADVARDYFIAARGPSLAWIYRAREGWFLHGLFA